MLGAVLQSGSSFLPIMRNHPAMDMIGPCPSWLTRRRSRNNSGFSYVSAALCSPASFQILDIIHNKVLIAAAVSAAIGQCSKPFTSVVLYGHRNLDFRNAFRSGGFPSTHSSATVATAMTLGLERGLSDSVFGLAVVYAFLVMYDSQGVRREVGSHAKVINKALFRSKIDKDDSSDLDANKESFSKDISLSLESKELKSLQQKLGNASLLLKPDAKTRTTPVEAPPFGSVPLKESVGHTEIEVIAGALLGVLVSLAVCAI